MWQPTHVKVTVKQAQNLLTKGKNGTNDAFVVIGIGKEKFQTSIKEKSLPNVDWREECELEIPSKGNQATIQLTVYHRNGLGLDEFLGQALLPLSELDVYEKPKYRWYRLKGKPEKEKKKAEKERGEIEAMVNFTVKSEAFLDANKKEKHKSSLTSLKHLGGSLMSIGGKEKQGLKNFAKSVSSKMDKIAKPKRRKSKTPSDYSSAFSNDMMESQQHFGQADPGVISDDDDFRFEDDVKVSTRTSSPMSTMSRGSSIVHEQVLDTDNEVGSYDDREHDFPLNFANSPPKPPRILDETREALSPHDTLYPVHTSKVTSFSDPKPFVTVMSSTPERVSQTIIEEESSFERDDEPSFRSFKTGVNVTDNSDDSPKEVMDDLQFALLQEPGVKADINKESLVILRNQEKIYEDDSSFLSAKRLGISATDTTTGFYSPLEEISFDSVTNESKEQNQLGSTLKDEASDEERNDDSKPVRKPRTKFYYDDAQNEGRDGRDSAISLGNDIESVSSSDQSSSLMGYENTVSNKLSQLDKSKAGAKIFTKSASEFNVLLRKDKPNRKGERRVVSAADNFSLSELEKSDIVRSGSLNEKRNTAYNGTPGLVKPTLTDEWERKLYGRLGMTGSNENMSPSDSRSSLNTSRESSVHDIRRDDSFTRLPEVKALTLDRKSVEREEDGKKQKKKIKSGFKSRFFNNKLDGSREKLNEEGRFVEGGNDRLPTIPARNSKLPQEIHDKFAGRSREDLLELILELQSNLNKQIKHSNELEEYIDNLLLRVMEATPHILQGPIKTKRSSKYGFGH